MLRESKVVQEMSLFSFCQKFQEAVLEGFRVSEESQNFPVMLGNHFTATLIKEVSDEQFKQAVKQESKEAVKAPVKETPTAAKRGPKTGTK